MARLFLAKRFVAGERIDDALDAAAALNALGMRATLDFLGEDIETRTEADRTREAYRELLDAIRTRNVDANVSVKLTALGLLIDERIALENLRVVMEAAAANPDPFVRIDMEGSAVTEATLRVFERAYTDAKNVGPVLQAYLHRTPADVVRAITLGARVRLCKGAYREPERIALQKMPEIRDAYLRCAHLLLDRGNYPAIATHDETLIDAVRAYAAENDIAPDRFEFQLLFGVEPQLQRRLVKLGHRVRIYVPFGTHWVRYFRRRIAERPENLVFAIRSIFSR